MLEMILAPKLLLLLASDHYPTGTDAIDPHSRAEADRQRMGQGHEPALGGGVGFGVRLRHQRSRRGDRDDRAASGAKRLLGGAGEQEGGGEIGVENLAPLRQRKCPQRPAHHDSGVGNEAIEPSEPLRHRLDRTRGGLFVSDIALDEDNAAQLLRIAALET